MAKGLAIPAAAIASPTDAGKLHRAAFVLGERARQRRAKRVARLLCRDDIDRERLAALRRVVHRAGSSRTPMRKTLARSAAAATVGRFGYDRAAGGDRDSGKTGARDVLDRLRTDRRQIETAILTGLGRLHQNTDAARRRHALLPAQIGHPGQEIVRALRGFDGEHMIVGNDRGLPDVERPERGDHFEPARNIGAVARRRLMASQHAFRDDDFRRHLRDPDDPQAAGFHHARHPGQQPIVAAAKRARDARHQPDRLPIEAQLGERRPQ